MYDSVDVETLNYSLPSELFKEATKAIRDYEEKMPHNN